MQTRVVFMGSPDFALPSLEALYAETDLVGVVTQPDRPVGRGRASLPCPVKARADELGLPTYQPRSLKTLEAMGQLIAWKPELIVVTAFGQILPQELLDLPAFGCLNVHASLLPRWRGASPIQAALFTGDEKTGVSIMRMDAGLDTGPVLAKREVPIRPGTTGDELSSQLAHLGAQVLLEVLPAYLSGELQPQPQPSTGASYAPKIKKTDGLMDFDQGAEVLLRLVQAFHPWPGTYFDLDGKKLKVLEAHVHDSFIREPGNRLIVNGQPAMGTGQGILVLDQVQLEGRRPMPGEVFLNGYPAWLKPPAPVNP